MEFKMKKIMTVTATIALLGAAPAFASTPLQGTVEDVSITLDAKKLDTSIAAKDRFAMLERVAARKCGAAGLSLEERRFHKACKAEVKRSVLNQVGDEALKYVAKKEGVL